MIKHTNPDFFPLRNPYDAPRSHVLSVEVEETLATSNTETIDEDEDEYNWDLN